METISVLGADNSIMLMEINQTLRALVETMQKMQKDLEVIKFVQCNLYAQLRDASPLTQAAQESVRPDDKPAEE